MLRSRHTLLCIRCKKLEFYNKLRRTKKTNLQRASSLAAQSIFFAFSLQQGARGSVVVKALCYKPEGHGFKSR
jgi:hypothetical protein